MRCDVQNSLRNCKQLHKQFSCHKQNRAVLKKITAENAEVEVKLNEA